MNKKTMNVGEIRLAEYKKKVIEEYKKQLKGEIQENMKQPKLKWEDACKWFLSLLEKKQ